MNTTKYSTVAIEYKIDKLIGKNHQFSSYLVLATASGPFFVSPSPHLWICNYVIFLSQ